MTLCSSSRCTTGRAAPAVSANNMTGQRRAPGTIYSLSSRAWGSAPQPAAYRSGARTAAVAALVTVDHGSLDPAAAAQRKPIHGDALRATG
jgi:hypothetical protein